MGRRPIGAEAMTAAERKRAYRERAAGQKAATAEQVDTVLLQVVKNSYAYACSDVGAPLDTVVDIVAEVLSRFPPSEAARVRARLGMPWAQVGPDSVYE